MIILTMSKLENNINYIFKNYFTGVIKFIHYVTCIFYLKGKYVYLLPYT